MVFAQAPAPCSLDQWRGMLKAAIRQNSTVDLARCPSAGDLINENLGFGERALHWAVSAERRGLTLQLLEFPQTSLNVFNDDKARPFDLFLEQSQELSKEVFEAFWRKAGIELAHAALIQFARVCAEPLAHLKDRRRRVLGWAKELDHGALPYRDLFAAYLRSDIRCPLFFDEPQSPDFLDAIWDEMNSFDHEEIEATVFDQTILYGYGQPFSDPRRLFRTYLRHPRLDRDFPSQGTTQEKDRYCLRALSAAFIADEASLRYLVKERHYPINYQNHEKRAVIFEAIRSGDENFVRKFLDDPRVDVALLEGSGKSVIFSVVERHLETDILEKIVSLARDRGELSTLLEARDLLEGGVTIAGYLRNRIEANPPAHEYDERVLRYLESVGAK